MWPTWWMEVLLLRFFKGLGASATSSLFVAPYFWKKISILWIFLFHDETPLRLGEGVEHSFPAKGPAEYARTVRSNSSVENGGLDYLFKSWKHVSWKVRILETLGNKHIFQVIQELIEVFWGNLGPFWVRTKWLSVRNHDSVKFACDSQSRYGKIQAVTYYCPKDGHPSESLGGDISLKTPEVKKLECASISVPVFATLQGINISHLGKRKIIFKMPFLGDMLVPWRVVVYKSSFSNDLLFLWMDTVMEGLQVSPS